MTREQVLDRSKLGFIRHLPPSDEQQWSKVHRSIRPQLQRAHIAYASKHYKAALQTLSAFRNRAHFLN